MAGGLFLIGMIFSIIGAIVLINRSAGRDVRALTAQSALLAKKGIAEDVAGLVGNVSALLKATNELVRTAAGIGVFLILLGVMLMIGACWLAFQLS
jgi:hypothetical protein